MGFLANKVCAINLAKSVRDHFLLTNVQLAVVGKCVKWKDFAITQARLVQKLDKDHLELRGGLGELGVEALA